MRRSNATISTRKAILIGKLFLLFIPFLIFMSMILLSCYFIIEKYAAPWIIAVVIPLGFILAIVFRLLVATEWKIWAFSNVNDLYKLKRHAIQHSLIASDNSIFRKLSFASNSQKQKIAKIESEMPFNDVIHDDATVPQKTEISLYTGENVGLRWFEFLLIASFFGLAIYLEDVWSFAAIPLILVYVSWNAKKNTKKSLFFTLDDNGIEFYGKQLISWANIENESVIVKISGKQKEHYLSFVQNGQSKLMNIEGIDNNFDRLKTLLLVYRFRFENQ